MLLMLSFKSVDIDTSIQNIYTSSRSIRVLIMVYLHSLQELAIQLKAIGA